MGIRQQRDTNFRLTISHAYVYRFSNHKMQQLLIAQVLQWMVDAGIRPSSQMYLDISSFAQKSGGAEYATLIKERIGMQMHISFNRIPLFEIYALLVPSKYLEVSCFGCGLGSKPMIYLGLLGRNPCEFIF